MTIAQHRLTGGGLAQIRQDDILFCFDEPRTVLSSSEYSGGLNKLWGVFNQKLPSGIISDKDLPGGSVAGYFAEKTRSLGWPSASGLLTSARMQCHGHHIAGVGTLAVEAFATGGVEGNAARAGELPQYYENADGFSPLEGTINLFVFLSFALSPGLMTKALITLTEAKSALLAELGVFSTYGDYTATGTGTDGIIIAINDDAPEYHDVGTHSQIGYLLASAAKAAIAQTVCRECYWTAGAQQSAVRVLEKLPTKDKAAVWTKFSSLTFDEQEALIHGLTVWHMLRERRYWGGLPDKAHNWLCTELFKKYPILQDWL